MTRFFGILLIIAGFGLAFGYPIYQKDFAGQEFARERVFDRENGGWQHGWKSVDVQITEDQSPVRIRLSGEILPGEYDLPATVPITLDLQGPDGKVLSDALQLGTGENNTQSGGKARKLSISTTDFGIIASGLHHLNAVLQTDQDISLSYLDAVFIANIPETNQDYIYFGFGLTGFGAFLYLVGTRMRKKRRKEKSQSVHWGRR